jgi:hypothetical protein
MAAMRSAVVFAIVLLALPACGCKSKPEGGGGTGPDKPIPGDPKLCDEARPAVETLYRGEPEAPTTAKPGDDAAAAQALAEQIIGDNVDMVMKDCKADPGRVAPCIRAATSVHQLERDCLPALDEEGSEGSVFAK